MISDSAGQLFARDQLDVTAKAAPASRPNQRDQTPRSQTSRRHRQARSPLPPPLRPPVADRFNAFPDTPFNRKKQDILDHLSSQDFSDKPSSEAFLEYLATLLARAELRSTDLGSLTDPSYYGQPDQDKIRFQSPFRLDPRGWEPHFVTTEWRPQGALLTSWQNPTFTEEAFCYKIAVQADPSYKMVPRFCSTRIRSHPFARFALYRMVGTGGGYTRTILGSLGSNLQQPGQPESRFIFPVLLRSSVCFGVMLYE